MIHRALMFVSRVIAALCFLAMCALGAQAQTLPYHADPSAREDAFDTGSIPAIRFLTSTGFPPFNYRDSDGELIGFHVDLARAICDVLEISCTVQAWPWDQVADALASNQGDALLAGLTMNRITAERFDFSSIYLMLPGRFVTRVEDAPGFDIDDLAGTRIAVREGSAHAQFLADDVGAAEAVPFETEVAALEALREGDIDVYFGDGMRAAFWINENNGCCDFAGEPYFNPRLFGPGFTAAVPAGRGQVRTAINFALQRLKRNDKLDELYLRWFPVSFY